jgi:hypothetical protein
MALFASARHHLGQQGGKPKGGGMAGSRKAYDIRAEWDAEAGVWWCANDELPLTEAPIFEQLVARCSKSRPRSPPKTGRRGG